MLWLVFALMALMAAGFAALALARPAGTGRDAGREARRAALKAQLAEADRDLAQARLNAHEHGLVRAEIARQLFRLEDTAGRGEGATTWGRPVLVASAVAVPLIAGAVYAATGSPNMPAQPFAERSDIRAMVGRAERQLRLRPDSTAGWLALAPIYLRLNRPADAAKAYRMALETGEHAPKRRAELLTEWSEAEVAATSRAVSTVRERLNEALSLDADNVKARFLLAVATEESAEPEVAAQAWKSLLDRHPGATEGWVEVARARLARLEVAKSIPKAERAERIEGMVAGLAARLEAEPDDLEGWTRLIRSYAVMGRAGAARSALDRARGQFAERADALALLTSTATQAGIAVE